MVDIDPHMTRRARERLAPFADRADVVEADVTALPFADGEFDVGLSFLMLHHVEGWERAVDELARVVRPGGRLLVYDLLDTRLNRWMHELTKSRVRILGAEDVRGLARDARLRDTRTRTSLGQARPRLRMWAMRTVSTRVLPVPAPASTRTGPSSVSTASRCSALSPAR